jgi:glycosyltransferase involved in cell wall biosynthesis
MRLLLTIPDYWPYVRRGSERVVHDLSTAMAGRGHDVTVVTRTPSHRRELVREGGVTVRYHPDHPTINRRLRLTDLEGFALTAGAATILSHADVHHSFYLSDAYAATQSARLNRRPVVLSIHGTPDRAWWEANRPRTHRWFLSTLERTPFVTVMTELSARLMREQYGFDPIVLTPGIDTGAYVAPRETGGQPTIVCAAAIDDARKRIHDVLIPAFELLASADPDLRLLLVGHGDPDLLLRPALAGLAPDISARVVHDPGIDLAHAYNRSSVGALTSHREAFGLVVLEALASGIPAVVADDGGSADLVSAETGRVFEAGSVQDCARGLAEALILSTEPGTEAACRARARAFDWSTRAEAYEALYRTAVAF